MIRRPPISKRTYTLFPYTPRFRSPDVPVHFGGPVEPRRGFVVHSKDWGGKDTIDVAGRWALSGTIDVLRAIAGAAGPRHWIVALGYAGWGEGQLEEEMTRHGWFSTTDRKSTRLNSSH